jgi:hypothetical protein
MEQEHPPSVAQIYEINYSFISTLPLQLFTWAAQLQSLFIFQQRRPFQSLFLHLTTFDLEGGRLDFIWRKNLYWARCQVALTSETMAPPRSGPTVSPIAVQKMTKP